MKNKKKKNNSKKVKINPSAITPLSPEIIKYLAEGGLLDDSEATPGSKLGNLLSANIDNISSIGADMIGTQDRNSAISSGVLSGAGKGAQIGSTILPGLGTAAGAVIGGTIGGITGERAFDETAATNKDIWKDKLNQTAESTVSYMGAYGGELPKFPNGGIIEGTEGLANEPEINPNTTLPADSSVTTQPTMVDNPNFKLQMDAYKASLNNRPLSSLSSTMDETMMEGFIADRNIKSPEFSQLPINKVLYDPSSVDPDTGFPSQYLEYYDKPPKQVEQLPTQATNSNPTDTLPVFRDNASGAPLPVDIYGRPEGNSDYQFMQSAEQEMNTLERRTKRQEQDALMEQYWKDNPKSGSNLALGGDIGSYLEMGGTPTEYNGNAHEQGGIQIGNSEVEDGEIRVGDYVFSDRLKHESGKTFSEEAKKITKEFEEYQNDGPAKRTQNKKLKELSYLNDQARLLKQKEDAIHEMTMMEGFRAFGGYIEKDIKGKYQVDPNYRKNILESAKANKMSYNKYVDSIYCYGGNMKKKLAGGGVVDPDGTKPLVATDEYPSLYDFGQGTAQPNVYNIFQVGDIGNEEIALLASNLPALSNLIGSTKGNTTKFDRLKLNEINLDDERRRISESVDKAQKIHRKNVRGTASSAGEALAALSAGTAGLTGKEMDALASVDAKERNMNVNIKNQEAMTNTGIAQQESIARQQDEALKASMRSMAVSDVSQNTQGYLKDKRLAEENDLYNTRLMSLLDTGEYKIVDDGNGGYKIEYAGKVVPTDNTKED